MLLGPGVVDCPSALLGEGNLLSVERWRRNISFSAGGTGFIADGMLGTVLYVSASVYAPSF
jgi:hypothetical protein